MKEVFSYSPKNFKQDTQTGGETSQPPVWVSFVQSLEGVWGKLSPERFPQEQNQREVDISSHVILMEVSGPVRGIGYFCWSFLISVRISFCILRVTSQVSLTNGSSAAGLWACA